MNLFVSILFWAGIVFVMDGSLGLLFQEKWQKLAGKVDIQRIAFVEIGVALVFLGLHYVLQSKGY
jgi:sulfite exporter TauE/SafE